MTSDSYIHENSEDSFVKSYLWKPVLNILNQQAGKTDAIFEVGCGNGTFANFLHQNQYKISGIDLSESGIDIAKKHFPHLNLEVDSVYSDLAGKHGQFKTVISLEVIEHCYYPYKYIHTIHNLLEKNGIAIISTPYHGYLKNLAIALLNRSDSHFTALWNHGHIKFFSVKTLGKLLEETGFKQIEFIRVGRIPPLAKSMIVIARK